MDIILFINNFCFFLLRSDLAYLVVVLAVLGQILYLYRFFRVVDCFHNGNELVAGLALNYAKKVLGFFFLAYFIDYSFFFDLYVSWKYFDGFMRTDAQIIFLKVFVLLFSFLVLVVADFFFKNEGRVMVAEFPLYILFSVFSVFCILQSNDLLVMGVFLEMFSYCLYIMPVLFRFSNLTAEATLRYFVLGAFSSAFLLMGICFVFMDFGTTNYDALYKLIAMHVNNYWSYAVTAEGLKFQIVLGIDGLSKYIGFIYIFCALFFKLGVFPFHYWIRETYEGSPLPVVVFFATVGKIPAFFVLFNLISLVLIDVSWGYGFSFSLLLEVVGVLSIIFGTFLSFYQSRIKSFFATTSIINMGYFCMALSLGDFGSGFLLSAFMLGYCFAMLAFCAVVVCFSTEEGGLVKLTDFAAILFINKELALLFTIALLSAAGMPPFPGFFPKAFIVMFFLLKGDFLVALFLMLANVANFVLYIRLIRFIYFFSLQSYSKEWKVSKIFDDFFLLVVLFLVVWSFLFGVVLPVFFWLLAFGIF